MTTSPADELRPVEVVPDRRTEQPGPQPACPELGERPLEDRDARPGQGRRVGDDAVALGLDPQPVLEPAHHQRDDRAHVVHRQALGLAASQPALDRLGRPRRAWATLNDTVALTLTPR